MKSASDYWPLSLVVAPFELFLDFLGGSGLSCPMSVNFFYGGFSSSLNSFLL